MNREMLMENLAKDIYSWCKENSLWGSNIIYFNGKAWANLDEWDKVKGKEIDEYLYEYNNKNPLDYFDYANTDTLSMSFEGVLHDVLNGYTDGGSSLEKEFIELLEKYGYYYEFGNSWNLSIYEL